MSDPNVPVSNTSEEYALSQLENEMLQAELEETQAELAVTAAAAPGIPQEYKIDLTAELIAAKEVALSPVPREPAKVKMVVDGGPVPVNGRDFVVSGAGMLSWAGKENLDAEAGDSVGLEEGDALQVSYFA